MQLNNRYIREQKAFDSRTMYPPASASAAIRTIISMGHYARPNLNIIHVTLLLFKRMMTQNSMIEGSRFVCGIVSR